MWLAVIDPPTCENSPLQIPIQTGGLAHHFQCLTVFLHIQGQFAPPPRILMTAVGCGSDPISFPSLLSLEGTKREAGAKSILTSLVQGMIRGRSQPGYFPCARGYEGADGSHESTFNSSSDYTRSQDFGKGGAGWACGRSQRPGQSASSQGGTGPDFAAFLRNCPTIARGKLRL